MKCCALPLLLSALAVGTGAHAADEPPMFTAPLVQSPGAWPVEPAVPSAAPNRAPRFPVRNRSYRALAEDVALAFDQACVRGRGAVDAATDWALAHGLSPLPKALGDHVAQLVDPTSGASVYGRDGAEDLMLVAGGQPAVCAVLTRQGMDGPRLRSSMERFVTVWAGLKAPPKPSVTLDTGEPPMRMVGYKFGQADRRHTLLVVAPVAASSGVAFLGYSADDSAAAP